MDEVIGFALDGGGGHDLVGRVSHCRPNKWRSYSMPSGLPGAPLTAAPIFLSLHFGRSITVRSRRR
jgi:hypothetical protein